MKSFKEIMNESKTDVQRYDALMKKTKGQWNVWDGDEKAKYIKKWAWDSDQMKIIRKGKNDEEMVMPKDQKPSKETTPIKDTKNSPEEEAEGNNPPAEPEQEIETPAEPDESNDKEQLDPNGPEGPEIDAQEAAEIEKEELENFKAECDIRKKKLKQMNSVVNDLTKQAQLMGNKAKEEYSADDDNDMQLNVKVLAAIKKVQLRAEM